MFADWKELIGDQKSHRSAPSSSVVILTPAPLYLTSSKGDEAMLLSTIANIRGLYPGAEIIAATASDLADTRATSLGIRPSRILEQWDLASCARALASHAPAHVFVIGADVMDGGYNPSFSLRLIALGDLARRMGARVTFLGFSFKKTPYARLGAAFDLVHKDVEFFLRDPASYERFSRNNNATGRLSADIAFLIEGTDSEQTRDYIDWIGAHRSAGRRVIGVNIHHSLLTPDRRDETERLVSAFARMLDQIRSSRPVAFLLLKHDFGEVSGDHHCLGPLYKQLEDASGSVRLQGDELSAREIKRLVKELDGVISARMHLAIASLGSGTPVFGLNYQDKMEGLFSHFQLGEEVYAGVDAVLDMSVQGKMLRFVEDAPVLREKVTSRLEHVQALSRSNFEPPIGRPDALPVLSSVG
jgi:polysaccharide pyruvyl transferase WcaK-like protein